MGQKIGSPSLYLVSSTAKPRNPQLAHVAEEKLKECRAILSEGDYAETVRLLDIVLLQLRLQARGISEAEHKAVCASMSGAGDRAAHGPEGV